MQSSGTRQLTIPPHPATAAFAAKGKIMNRLIAGIFFAVLATSGEAKTFTVFSPDQGVLCDRKSGFCADSTGISMAYTEQFLGKKAAAKLMKTMGTDSDMSSFTMSNGVHCEMKAKNCTTSKNNDTPEAAANGALFRQ
jgi:hypothetical protein